MSNAEGRALETAVARRFADTACSLAITGDKEDAAHARALWEASAALTGLLPPHTGDTLRAAANIVTAVNRPAMRGRIVSVSGGALISMLSGCGFPKSVQPTAEASQAILVARDLGSDPEAWRRAMREWTANGNKSAAPIKDPRLEVPGALLDDLRTEAGEHSIDAETIVRSAVREIKRRRAAMDILTAKRAEAQETADRRMALLLQADERDDAVRAVLGATDSENTVDAAKRVVNAGVMPCETCREDRRKAIAERDAAIEARAQMQARLVAAERERDAAQEETKSLRVAVANKMSESMLAIMEGIANGPTMEWRNGKP